MNKKQLIRFALQISGWALFAGLSVGALPAAEPASAAARPNFLVIVADDLGWKDVGFHGSEIRTPQLDRLARESVQLDQFYVCPTCSPTRASLLTGKYPSRVGILNPLGTDDPRSIPKDMATLPGTLRTAGYTTALIGKWHLGPRPEVGPRQYGFDHTYGMLHGAVDKYTHLDNNGNLTWHREDQPLKEEGHADDLITAEAIRCLENYRAGSKPFFLEVAFGHVHLPLQEEAKWIDGYRGQINSESRRLYAASVSHMDDNVGQLLDALRAKGLEANTLVIFISDNGGIKGPYKWRGSTPAWYGGKFVGTEYEVIGDNRPWRGGKGEVYEGGIRVPAFVRWPGKLSASVVKQPIGVVDIFPLLAGLAQAKAPGDLDGLNPWPWIAGKQPTASRTFFWQTPIAAAFREGDWKLVQRQPKAGNPTLELFDLSKDPEEAHDLAASAPEKVAALKKKMQPLVVNVVSPKEN